MGSIQSYITPQFVLTSVLLVGAVAFAVKPNNAPLAHVSAASPSANKRSKKKKHVATQLQSADDQPTPNPIVVPFPRVIPGQLDPTDTSEDNQSVKRKKPKKKRGKATPAQEESPPAQTSEFDALSSSHIDPRAPQVSVFPAEQTSLSVPTKAKRQSISALLQSSGRPATSTNNDTDGSWTRIESSRRQQNKGRGTIPHEMEDSSVSGLGANMSDAFTASAHTEDSSPVRQSHSEDDEQASDEAASPALTVAGGRLKKTLAEKLLSRRKKTVADDMLETSDYPELTRVIRVRPRAGEKPATGFSWGDYEDVRVDDGGGGYSAHADEGSTMASDEADGEDDGWGVVKSRGRSKLAHNPSSQSNQSQHQAQKAPETLTKRQRQNAARRERQKDVKADEEAQRIAALAKHKRELERVRMAEQLAAPRSKIGGGMKAAVDAGGKLVWE